MAQIPQEWKEIKDKNKVVKYHIKDQFVDKVLIKEDENLIVIEFEIKHGEPFDILKIKNKSTMIEIYLEKNPDSEDPMFTYPEFFENSNNIEELINDIKQYILSLVSYALNLS